MAFVAINRGADSLATNAFRQRGLKVPLTCMHPGLVSSARKSIAPMTNIPSSSEAASRRMSRVRQKGTDAEMMLRRELFRRGLRYRVDFQVSRKPRRVANIFFPGLRIAIFVDGCFWHGCPIRGSWPKSNADLWRQKIQANRERDADTNSRLIDAGWKVLRYWQHEAPEIVADGIEGEVERAKAGIPVLKKSHAERNRTPKGFAGKRMSHEG